MAPISSSRISRSPADAGVRWPRRALAVALATMVAGGATPAAAELSDDAVALVRDWRRAGAEVLQMAPLFMSHGETRSVPVPPVLSTTEACLRVTILAERQVSFVARSLGPSGFDPRRHWLGGLEGLLEDLEEAGGEAREARSSQAGVATLDVCGRARARLGAVQVAMQSERGAVEVVFAAHARERSLAEVDVVLPERAVGLEAPGGEGGVPLRLDALELRAARADKAARLDGARMVVRADTQASLEGNGSVLLKLSGGCHRLAVLADADDAPALGAPGGGPPSVDLDAEVRRPGADVALAVDRAHAPDARLDFCLGDAERVELRFAGAPPGARVSVLDGYWPPPAGLPDGWGPEARAGLAWALFRQRAPEPASAPTTRLVGGAGVTILPVDVEPGRCYVAALALMRGEASAGRLTARVGGRSHYDDATDAVRSAAVSFCAQDEELAQLQVELRARAAWWLLTLWAVGEQRP
jgi:hypothetical protein